MPNKQYFTFEALPARKGDSLLIHFGTNANPKLCIVDGGPSKVYKPALRPRLMDIRKARSLPDGKSLLIDLLMISHLDDDHLKGVLDMARELKDSDEAGDPQLAKILVLWHNVFDDIIGNTPDQLKASITAGNNLASTSGNWFGDKLDHDSTMVLASVGQGHKLRGYSEFFNWDVNPPFENDELIMVSGTNNDVVDKFGGGLVITIIGPIQDDLIKLQKKYDKFLKDNNLGRDTPEATLAAFSQDTSVTNLSSIVTLLEIKGKSILLTGDALGSKILEGLEKRGFDTANQPLKVDILKIPHHGSNRNVTTKFFRQITADHYVFCGNGEHGNPERETLEIILEARGNAPMTWHFTYPIKIIDKRRKKEQLHDGHNWVATQHSLEPIIATAQQANPDLIINEPDDRTGVRIDLLEAIEI